MATISNMGIAGVGSGILHPKQKNRWNVTFANLGGGTNSQPISMQAVTVSRPTLKFAEVELHRYNSVAYVAGKHSWESLKLTVEDDVTSSASSVIQAQLQKQQWLIGAEGQWLAAAGEGSLYKFVTYINQLDGNAQVIETWTVEGCWIMQTTYGELDYKDGEAVKIDLEIRFDHARQSIGGYSQGTGNALGGPGA
jgi:hypothetical protein